jgi:DNA (cytosine-5)-methyltransferase 1
VSPIPSVISLFSGAGGFDVGLEAAGFAVRFAIDSDPAACRTLRANRAGRWAIHEGDLRVVSSEDICEVTGMAPEEPYLLAGGPPCQPFSKAAFWRHGDTKRLVDPRADTLTAYLRVLRDLRPRAYILENVSGLMFRGKDEGVHLLRSAIDAINAETGAEYSFRVMKLNAADYGVPQLRERVFILGERNGKAFESPPRTHADPVIIEGLSTKERRGIKPWRTSWDAIGDLEDDSSAELMPTGQWAHLLPSIPEGGNYLFHTSRGGGIPIFGWRRRYWSFLLKLAKSKPSWTIQAQPGPAVGPFHWLNRRLSQIEMARLQTFPGTYQFVGSRGDVQRQIGNAVPSLLGEVLGREMRRQFFGDSVLEPTPTLTIRARPRMPAPERRRAVPRCYRNLVGEHSPHPGTGKGFAAHRRNGLHRSRGQS